MPVMMSSAALVATLDQTSSTGADPPCSTAMMPAPTAVPAAVAATTTIAIWLRPSRST